MYVFSLLYSYTVMKTKMVSCNFRFFFLCVNRSCNVYFVHYYSVCVTCNLLISNQDLSLTLSIRDLGTRLVICKLNKVNLKKKGRKKKKYQLCKFIGKVFCLKRTRKIARYVTFRVKQLNMREFDAGVVVW